MTYTMLPGTRAPVKVWTDPSTIESEATQQLRNIGSLPWVEGVAVMPDVHYGKGATVGSVIAMRQALAPAAVGVDIGCGMSAVRTNLTADDLPDDLGPLRSAIEARPVGFNAHGEPVNVDRVHGLPTAGWDRFWAAFAGLHGGVSSLEGRATRQMGTLGGGNHFIEVCIEEGGDAAGRVWLMLHSGSPEHRQGAGRATHCRRSRAAAQPGSAGSGPCSVRHRYARNPDGKLQADLTVTKLADDDFWVVASDTAHGHVLAWLARHIGGADVAIEDVTEDWAQLNVQGPQSRDLLATLTDADLSTEAFPFRTARFATLAGVGVLLVRITYVGELGYELYLPAAGALAVYDAVAAAGATPVGLKTLASCRMEKG